MPGQICYRRRRRPCGGGHLPAGGQREPGQALRGFAFLLTYYQWGFGIGGSPLIPLQLLPILYEGVSLPGTLVDIVSWYAAMFSSHHTVTVSYFSCAKPCDAVSQYGMLYYMCYGSSYWHNATTVRSCRMSRHTTYLCTHSNTVIYEVWYTTTRILYNNFQHP